MLHSGRLPYLETLHLAVVYDSLLYSVRCVEQKTSLYPQMLKSGRMLPYIETLHMSVICKTLFDHERYFKHKSTYA